MARIACMAIHIEQSPDMSAIGNPFKDPLPTTRGPDKNAP